MIITVVSGKGGTGKTSVATSLASYYAKNKKTLLIDTDVDCPNDHLLLGIERKEKEDIMHPIPVIDENLCRKCGKCASVCKYDALIYAKGKIPAFLKSSCIGCMACMNVCPYEAISQGEKLIGKIFVAEKDNLSLVSGELLLGEIASGEIVAKVKSFAFDLEKKYENTIIDAPPGIGCPLIASILGSDYVIAVTEPTLSAMHDLQRVLFIAEHFNIPKSIIINKYNLEPTLCEKIEKFAFDKNIPILAKISYKEDFVKQSVKNKTLLDIYPDVFSEIVDKI